MKSVHDMRGELRAARKRYRRWFVRWDNTGSEARTRFWAKLEALCVATREAVPYAVTFSGKPVRWVAWNPKVYPEPPTGEFSVHRLKAQV